MVKAKKGVALMKETLETVTLSKVPVVLGEVEEGISIPPNQRESKYNFGLDELHENQAWFIAPPEGVSVETLKLNLRNHMDKERKAREFRQNFVMRDAEKNGVIGVRVFCVSIQDKPMRKPNKIKVA